MDFIHEAEKKLWHYKDMKRSLEWQEKEISKLKWEGYPSGCSAILYDGMPKGGNKDEAVNIAFKIKMYMDMVESTEAELKEIDKVLEEISQDKGCERYGEILRLWYIEGLPKEKIMEQIDLNSLSYIYELRDKAIRKFAVSIFGFEALKAI